MKSRRVVVITGALGGIGRALTESFAAEGAALVLADIALDGAQTIIADLKSAGVNATFVCCDVSREPDVIALIQTAVRTHGRIDVAINNAGITHPPSDLAEFPSDEFDRVLGVNLRGVFLGMRHELPVMIAQRGGVIVNVASILGLTGLERAGAYVAAKHGVVGLTRTGALETAGLGVRVNAICPGFVETPMVTEQGLAAAPGTEAHAAIAALHPVGRMGRPAEIAAAAAYLASDAASFVTGQAMIVDGGYLAR